MIAVVTALVCLPLGWFVRSRLAANTTYAVAYLWAFVFQTLYLQAVPGTFPEGEFPLAYGLVTASVFGVGFGLIAAARAVRSRRDAGRDARRRAAPAVDPDADARAPRSADADAGPSLSRA